MIKNLKWIFQKTTCWSAKKCDKCILELAKTMKNVWGSDEIFENLKKLVRDALHGQP
jgi:hypothetical protein